jgi:hypothetical protein
VDRNVDLVVMIGTVLPNSTVSMPLKKREGKLTKVSCFSRSSDMAAAWDVLEWMEKVVVQRV